MPTHHDIFNFEPEALKRVQRASYEGCSHSYIGTRWPKVIYFFDLETEIGLQNQGRYQAYAQRLDEHCDALGITRIAAVMSRGDVSFEKLVEVYKAHGFEVIGDIIDPDSAFPSANLKRKPRPLPSPENGDNVS